MHPSAHRHRDRKAQALALRAGGASFVDIALKLGIAEATAARLVHGGMAALGISTYVELVVALRSSGRTTAVIPPGLTGAECAVATLVLHGASNAAVARERGTSVRTVANQLQSIYAKLGLVSRRELVARLLCPADE